MSDVSFQTVRLAEGKHRTPDHGACVVELSSMIAGEPFSDRPQCVCRVIGALLRPYNDKAGDRRQDLYPYAAAIVGTRGSTRLERRRLKRCLEEIDALDALGGSGTLRHRAQAWHLRRLAAQPLTEFAIDRFGFDLVDLLRRRDPQWHDRVVALVGDLAEMGVAPPSDAPAPQLVAQP
jgi:hypothetical protein